MKRIDLMIAAMVIACLCVFGCATAREKIQTFAEHAIYPTTLAACDQEINASTERLDTAREARDAFNKWAVTSQLQNSKFVVQALKAMDQNIQDADEWIIKMEAHRKTLEAETVQQQIDAAPKPTT